MTVPTSIDRTFREAAAASGMLDASFDLTDSPVGELFLATTDAGVCCISFTPESALDWLAQQRGSRVLRVPRRLVAVRRELDEYFGGRRRAFDVSIDVGSLPAFNRLVLDELARVPYGELTTYGTLARRISHPDAARAVGGALNRNPIPIILPCHRVVGASGKLTGYAGGLERKQALISLEGGALF
jgi:methylated-DNA-[protein]-cysteine S-methyltransferase